MSLTFAFISRCHCRRIGIDVDGDGDGDVDGDGNGEYAFNRVQASSYIIAPRGSNGRKLFYLFASVWKVGGDAVRWVEIEMGNAAK